MRVFFISLLTVFFVNIAFADYSLSRKALVDKTLLSEINYYYIDIESVDENSNLGLDFKFKVFNGFELNLFMPFYSEGNKNEFLPTNPWLGAVFDINEMFTFKLAGELSFFRNDVISAVNNNVYTYNKSYNLNLAILMHKVVAEGMVFFTELSLAMASKVTTDEEFYKFGIAIGIKPGLEFKVDALIAQLYLDFQETVAPNIETYIGMAVNFEYELNNNILCFLGTSVAVKGNKELTENNYLNIGQDEFAWSIMSGFKFLI